MKKNVLIVNKFYYTRGGDCVATLNLEQLLKKMGYNVSIFSMKYAENIPSDWDAYFASEVSFSGGIKDKLHAIKRIFGYGDIKKSFQKILDKTNPDIVHLHNIHSYISPIVAKLAKEKGCKVVWTLHDYKLLCPSYRCLRGDEVCERCFSNKFQVIKNKCMKDSFVASVLAYAEARKWNAITLEKYTDAFICPSYFIAKKMIEGGFDKNKINVNFNFLDPKKYAQIRANKGSSSNNKDCYSYIGRLSQEKGVATLLEYASTAPYKLKIAGTGPLFNELKSKYENGNIEFLGHLDAEGISNLLEKSRFTVCPSEWYENNPLSVIESLCCGTPVLGANIGGIPELINDENGMIFGFRDEADLKNKIDIMWNKSWNYNIIKENALTKFSADSYFDKIEKIYMS